MLGFKIEETLHVVVVKPLYAAHRYNASLSITASLESIVYVIPRKGFNITQRFYFLSLFTTITRVMTINLCLTG